MKHLYNTTKKTAIIEITEAELSELLLIVNTASIYDENKGHAASVNVDNDFWLRLYEVREAVRQDK